MFGKSAIVFRVVLVVLSVLVVVSGCGKGPAPIAIVIIVDPTESAHTRREMGLKNLREVMDRGYLPKGSRLAIVRCDCEPTMVWSGTVLDKGEVLQAYREASKGRDSGTDPWKALDIANQWLQEATQVRFERKLCTGWIDCVADPCKAGPHIRVFQPPVLYTWPGSKAAKIEVYLFGVNQDIQSRLKRAWTPVFDPIPHLFTSGERIRPETMGLNRSFVL